MTPEAAIIESMFVVVNKESETVPFILNSTQRKLDENMTARNIIPKARQEGVSYYVLARFLAKCLGYDNQHAVIVSHESDATQRLLQRCRHMLSNIRGPAPSVGRDALNAITFPKTNSSLWIGTAGARKFGRGDTINLLHCSEYALWPHPKELLSGLLQAVPTFSGEVFIESTGKGKGNDYHKRAKRAFEGKGRWSCHFFNWVDFEEYRLPLTADDKQTFHEELTKLRDRILTLDRKGDKYAWLLDEWGEVKLYFDGTLDLEQLAFRRLKLEELDFDIKLFEQEYPISFDQCFQASGDSIFQRVNYVLTDQWVQKAAHYWGHKNHPREGMIYSAGVDPSAGVGQDNGAIEVFCVNTGEQVAEFGHDKIPPDALGLKAAEIAHEYNDAFITVEANNHGPITINALMEDAKYPLHLLYDMNSISGQLPDDRELMKMGFKTTARTRPIMLGKLRTGLAKDLTIYSPLLYDELTTFVEKETGKLGAQEGCKDDYVMSSACSLMGFERASLMIPGEVGLLQAGSPGESHPFTLEGIIDRLARRKTGSPYGPQTLSARKGLRFH